MQIGARTDTAHTYSNYKKDTEYVIAAYVGHNGISPRSSGFNNADNVCRA